VTTLPRLAALLVAVLLVSPAGFASPALAQGKPRQGQGPAAAPPNPDGRCSAEQMAVIRAAFAEARTRQRDATAFLLRNPNHEHVTLWFGSTPRSVLVQNFQTIAAGLAREQVFAFQCLHPQSCARGPFAYARTAGYVLGFCQGFFDARDEGRDSRFGIMIHEVSHAALGTIDAGYGPNAGMKLAREEPHRAVNNADNYEYFVEFLPRR
jgi:peptidyl-Lys metalloendopeptidase